MMWCVGLENVCETVDEDCAVTQWSSWSPCSVTCGKGTSQRLRYFLNKEDMIRCQRDTQETQMCAADVLDCDDARLAAQSAGMHAPSTPASSSSVDTICHNMFDSGKIITFSPL